MSGGGTVDRYAGVETETRDLLEWFASQTLPVDVDIDTLRQHNVKGGARFGVPRVEVGNVQDVPVDGTHRPAFIRIYDPIEPRPGAGSAVIFFVHGGSWMMGSAEVYDNFCRLLCQKIGLKVLNVEYGLAPENPFPHQTEDCTRIFDWTRQHAESLSIDPDRMFLCGDSSGANLVAVMTHALKARQEPPTLGQILLYPSVAMYKHHSYPSWRKYGTGFLIGESSLSRTVALYLQGKVDMKDPRVSPVLFPDFSDLPAALVITADYDPIRDGGREYAAKLVAAGVPTRFVECRGTAHGFMFYDTPKAQSQKAMDEVDLFVGRQLASAAVRP